MEICQDLTFHANRLKESLRAYGLLGDIKRFIPIVFDRLVLIVPHFGGRFQGIPPPNFHPIFYWMGLKDSVQLIDFFKSLGASLESSMIEIAKPHLPPQKNYTGVAVLPHKDILEIVYLDFKYQVKAMILVTASPPNPLVWIYFLPRPPLSNHIFSAGSK